MQFYHRGPWGGIYHNIAKRIAASPVTFPSIFDVHEDEPPEPLTIEEIQELVERYAACRRSPGRLRLRRRRDPRRRRPPVRHLPVALLEPARRRVRGAELGEPHPLRPARSSRQSQAAGPDFAIQVFINGLEFGVGDLGLSLEENKQLAQIWEQCGVDSLHVRSHWVGMHQGSYLSDTLFYPEPHIPLSEFPKEMDWTHYGSPLQPASGGRHQAGGQHPRHVGMRVRCADRRPGHRARARRDFVGMNRRLFADAEYPNKMRTGRALEVQPCTKCGHCSSTYNVPRHCRINACFGTDSYDLTPLEIKKKVAGHRRRPGRHAGRPGSGHARARRQPLGEGQVPRADRCRWRRWSRASRSRTCARSSGSCGGRSRSTESTSSWARRSTPAAIEAAKPDVVIIAAGGKPTLPDVPGVYGKNVVRSSDLYGTLQFYLRLLGPKTLRDLTSVWMPVGKKAVIIGGAIQGCQLGEFLTKRGRKVTIVDTDEELGKSMYPERKTRLFYWFDKKGVERLAGVQLVEITRQGPDAHHQRGRAADHRGGQRDMRAAIHRQPRFGGRPAG